MRGPCEHRLRRQGATDGILISDFCLQHCLVQSQPSVEQQISGATTVGVSNPATLLVFSGSAEPLLDPLCAGAGSALGPLLCFCSRSALCTRPFAPAVDSCGFMIISLPDAPLPDQQLRWPCTV